MDSEYTNNKMENESLINKSNETTTKDEKKVREILDDLLYNYQQNKLKGVEHKEMELNIGFK